MAEKRWLLDHAKGAGTLVSGPDTKATMVMPTSEGDTYKQQRDQLLEAIRAHREQTANPGPATCDRRLYNVAASIEEAKDW